MEKSMSEHYFSSDPTSVSRPRSFALSVEGMNVTFKSDNGVFSADKVDKGSRVLIETVLRVTELSDKRLLDIGCGYGTIGITLAKAGANVVMCDVNERALSLCEENIKSNRVSAECLVADGGIGAGEDFDIVVTNPPIRTGKQVFYRFFDNALNSLKEGGEMFVVIRKQQGAESAKKYIYGVFGNCEVIEKEAGYWILYSVKR